MKKAASFWRQAGLSHEERILSNTVCWELQQMPPSGLRQECRILSVACNIYEFTTRQMNVPVLIKTPVHKPYSSDTLVFTFILYAVYTLTIEQNWNADKYTNTIISIIK